VPTVEEVAAAVRVPTVEEVASAVRVPTVEEVASAVRVPTVEEVASAVRVPTVEEVAAIVPHPPDLHEIRSELLNLLLERPAVVTHVELSHTTTGAARVGWVMNTASYASQLLFVSVQLIASGTVLAKQECNPFEAHECSFCNFPYDTNVQASVFVKAQTGNSDVTLSNIMNVRAPFRTIIFRGASLESSTHEEGVFDTIDVNIDAVGAVTLRVKASEITLGETSFVGDGNTATHRIPLHGTAKILDIEATNDIKSERIQLRVSKTFKLPIQCDTIRLKTPLLLSNSPLIVFQDVRMQFSDVYGHVFDSNRYCTTRCRGGNVVAATSTSLHLAHTKGTLLIDSCQPFCVL
jgi:hypothetical protein